MPTITHLFSEPVKLPFSRTNAHPFEVDHKGPYFFEYPLSWFTPPFKLRRKDLRHAPTPLWIVDIDPRCRLGRLNKTTGLACVIDLPGSMTDYFKGRKKSVREKFNYLWRKNADLDVAYDQFEDLKVAWPWYLRRMRKLFREDGLKPPCRKEFNYAWKYFNQENIHVISFRLKGKLVGVNISQWKDGIVYDLAFMRKDSEKLAKRGMGFYAILKNIEKAIESQMYVYHLLSGSYPYKAEFATRLEAQKHYIACSKSFAKMYRIPMRLVSRVLPDRPNDSVMVSGKSL